MSVTDSGVDLLDGTIATAAAALRRRSISVGELVSAALEAIDRASELNAFTAVYGDQARAAADAHQALLETGYDVGPLHAIPVAVKDNIGIAGVSTTAGSVVLPPVAATADATVVAALKRAGAIVVGRNNMYELAWGGTTVNPHFGTGGNPWGRNRSPGRSSGGSGAAVAARIVFASLGTDTGGSVRVPAALNGITGIRPTMGRVSNAGVFPLAWTLDTVGPLAKSSEDCAIVLAAIAGHDPFDPQTSDEVVPDYVGALCHPLKGMRIGVLEHYSDHNLQPAVRDAFRSAVAVLEDLGGMPTTVEIDDLDVVQDALRVLNAVEASVCTHRGSGSVVTTTAPRCGRSSRPTSHSPPRTTCRRSDTGHMCAHSSSTRSTRSTRWSHLPCTSRAPEHGQVSVDIDGVANDVLHSPRFTVLASLTGLPALSVPIGFDGTGLPIGLQVIGPAFHEARLLQIGHRFQGMTAYHLARPA